MGEVEGEAGFVWKENGVFCLGLIVEEIGEDHGEWGSGEGANFPSGDAGRNGGGPLSGEDHAWGVFGERDAGWLGEIKSEFGLNAADGFEKKLETFLEEIGDLGADFGLSGGGQSLENFFGEVRGSGRVGGDASGVDLDIDGSGALTGEGSADGDIGNGVSIGRRASDGEEDGEKKRESRKHRMVALVKFFPCGVEG